MLYLSVKYEAIDRNIKTGNMGKKAWLHISQSMQDQGDSFSPLTFLLLFFPKKCKCILFYDPYSNHPQAFILFIFLFFIL